jgi:hypothetical protein
MACWFRLTGADRARGPARAILLVPGLDLAVDLGRPADRVGPILQPAAVAREIEAIEPHHIDVAGAIGLGPVEDLDETARHMRAKEADCIRPPLARPPSNRTGTSLRCNRGLNTP